MCSGLERKLPLEVVGKAGIYEGVARAERKGEKGVKLRRTLQSWPVMFARLCAVKVSIEAYKGEPEVWFFRLTLCYEMMKVTRECKKSTNHLNQLFTKF